MTFVTVVNQSNTCMQIGRPVMLIAVVSYDFTHCNTCHCLVRKVKQQHRLGEADFCCVSCFAFVTIFLAKNYNYIFEFVKLMSVSRQGFLRKRHCQWRHNYVELCKYWWDILQFFSHTDFQDNSCQKLWKVV